MTVVSRRRAFARAQNRFLKYLRQGRSVRAAADAANVPRSSLYKWRQTLPGVAAGPRHLPKPPVPAPQWIEIPSQGRRHVSTIGRGAGGP